MIEGGDLRIKKVIRDLIDQLLDHCDRSIEAGLVRRRSIVLIGINHRDRTFHVALSVRLTGITLSCAELVICEVLDTGIDIPERLAVVSLEVGEVFEVYGRQVSHLLSLGYWSCATSLQ